MTDHLALAKEYIAKGDDYYSRAAAEIVAAKEEYPELTWVEIGRRLGRDESWVRRLVESFRKSAAAPETEFKVNWQSGDYEKPAAKRVLSDPEQRKQVIAALPPEQIEAVIEDAHEVARDRMRARRAEHDTEPASPTARDLMGDEPFDPAEYWADTLVIRVNRNARELASLIKRGGGLLFGTMPPEEAFDYLHEAERLIAEARAAAQEQVRDRSEV